MSTYAEAVEAQQYIIANFFDDPNCISVIVVPASPPNDYEVQVNCSGAIDGLPTNVNGVVINEVLGPVPPNDAELNEGARGSYVALQDSDAGTTLSPPHLYIATLAAPQAFNLPRAFITPGGLRISNVGPGTLTIIPFAGDTVSGQAQLVMPSGEWVSYFSDGNTNWVRVG